MDYNLNGLNELSKKFHDFQIKMGFKDSNKSQRLMLVHSEISEAFEAIRKNKFANKKQFEIDCDMIDGTIAWKNHFEDNIKDSHEDEIADSIIRLLAYCGENNIDIEFHIKNKMKYNEMRGFKYGGKSF